MISNRFCAVGIGVLVLMEPSMNIGPNGWASLLHALKWLNTRGQPNITQQFVLPKIETFSPPLLLWVGTASQSSGSRPVCLIRLLGVLARLLGMQLYLRIIHLFVLKAISGVGDVQHLSIIRRRRLQSRHTDEQRVGTQLIDV